MKDPQRFGQYLLLERVGLGGMAEVYRALRLDSPQQHAQIALKKILPHLAENSDFVRMFTDEAKIALSMKHPNIVQTYDYGAVGRCYFMAMEYIAGPDLLRLLVRCAQRRVQIPRPLALFITTELLKALENVHRLGITHRDVSPANVLLSYGGEVKLSDFGVARSALHSESTSPGVLKGKLSYMSPEQVRGEQPTAQSDLFCVGILLYEMLTMGRLFQAESDLELIMQIRTFSVEPAIERLPAQLPSVLKRILRRALAVSVADRYSDALSFHEALTDYLFSEDLRLDHRQLALFLQQVFPEEREAERAKQAQLGELYTRHSQLPLPAAPFPSVRQSADTLNRLAAWTPDSPSAYTPHSRMRVRQKAGAVTASMSMHSFVHYLQAHGLKADEESFSIDEGPWQPLNKAKARLDDLMVIAQAQELRPDFQGYFEQIDLPKLLGRYAASAVTGRMVLQFEHRLKEIHWRLGRPEYATSNLHEELLGEILVRHRLISRPQLDAALAAQQDAQSGPLGAVLLQQRSIQRPALFKALSTQVRLRLLELFNWPGGHYAFYHDEANAAQIVPLGQSSWQLIAEGIALRLPLSLIQQWFVPHTDRVLYRRTHHTLRLADLQLSAQQVRIWRAVEHGVSLRSQLGRLAALSQTTEAALWQTLFLMERLDFLCFDSPD